MGITKIPSSGGGTDWTGYTTKQNTNNETISVADTYQTVIDETGEGWLSKAVVGIANRGDDIAIKITIDGTDVYELKNTVYNGATGIISCNEVNIDNSDTAFPMNAAVKVGVWYLILEDGISLATTTTLTTGSITYSGTLGIKFITSLKVEIKNIANAEPIYWEASYQLKD